MNSPLDNLPENILDGIVAHSIRIYHGLKLMSLCSLGSRVHASAVRVLFSTVYLEDDMRTAASGTSIAGPLLSNPIRYSHTVKAIVIQDPKLDSDSYLLKPSCASPRPLDSLILSAILKACSGLERFAWESSFLPPDGLCEILVQSNLRLTGLSCSPNYVQQLSVLRSSPASVPKWDAPSLPLLSFLSLTCLRISRISHVGAQALSSLLSQIAEYSALEDVAFDFVWLDDLLCERLVAAGRKIRHLKLGTSGTKLSDSGIVVIAEQCDNLEHWTLEGVQGRLSRSLWTKPRNFPTSLKNMRIVISEAGSHHSWTTDHLFSIHAMPIRSLVSLSIVRQEIPHVEDGVPLYDTITENALALRSVPKDFVESMRNGSCLTTLECDWWTWSPTDLKMALEGCPKLETIKFCLDAPFSKLASLTATFASLINVQKISFTVNPAHAPGKPPVPLLPFTRPSLPTPNESPVLRSKSVLPHLLDFDQMQTQTCIGNNIGDPSLPLLRDVKRFARKCPKLAFLEWHGKFGRGSWRITRPAPTNSKISTNVSVEYMPPVLPEIIYAAMLRERRLKEAADRGWDFSTSERTGNSWTNADAPQDNAYAEKEKSTKVPVAKDKSGRSRNHGKKNRVPSITTCDFGEKHTPHLVTPKKSRYSRSPQSYLPLTPAHSEASVSTVLSGCPESPPSSPTHKISTRSTSMRSLSEPQLRWTSEGGHGQYRSATSISKKDSNITRSDRIGLFGKKPREQESTTHVGKSGRGQMSAHRVGGVVRDGSFESDETRTNFSSTRDKSRGSSRHGQSSQHGTTEV